MDTFICSRAASAMAGRLPNPPPSLVIAPNASLVRQGSTPRQGASPRPRRMGPSIGPATPQNPGRVKSKFPSISMSFLLIQLLAKFCFRFPENHVFSAPSRLDGEGRIAIVTTREAGLRWTFWRRARVLRADERRRGGRQNRVVLTPRRWCQARWRDERCGRWEQESPVPRESAI